MSKEMKIFYFIEHYFWMILLAGIVLGLSYPVYNDFLMTMLKPLLMVMLFLVFLKTDLVQILTQIKDYRLMAYLACLYMFVIPVALFLILDLFSRELATGILLLMAMPAAVSAATLTDIVKGNIALASGITIITSILAPFTVPLLFRLVSYENLSIDTSEIFTDLVVLVFIPLVLSQLLKKIIPGTINKGKNKITSVNILIIFILIYTAMGSQRELILSGSVSLLWQLITLYLIFILLHVAGYFIGFNQDKESRIAITIGTAYKNNGMAIVLAALHFEPSVLVLMVLSEFPWNTLLAPFRRLTRYL
jgi:bile acid:Na+ symporter, BASS family